MDFFHFIGSPKINILLKKKKKKVMEESWNFNFRFLYRSLVELIVLEVEMNN